jgi:hypothetical protein
VWCGEDPKPAWCPKLHRVSGKPDVLVDGTSLFVATTMLEAKANKKLATEMCKAIASSSFDDNAQPIGFYHVHVQSRDPNTFLADCNIPGY